MSKQKHTGENVAGVTVQMSLIPLKTDPEQQKFIPLKTDHEQPATIVVRVDDMQKGTPDNIQEFKIPKISKLTLEGETFVKNKVQNNLCPEGMAWPKTFNKAT